MSEVGSGGKIELPSSGFAEDILGKLKGAPAGPEKPAASFSESLADDEESAGRETLHLVTFHLNGEEYALEISQIREIIRVNSWTRVPNAPRHIKGVINLRGHIIPVIDPKVKMALEETPLTRNARVMVVEDGKKDVGMLVDMVSQVIRLPLDVIEPPPEEVASADKGYIKGVGKLGERLIILLDFGKIAGREAAVEQAV